MGIEGFAAIAGTGRLWARCRLRMAAVLLAVLPVSLAAQQPAVITGRVTNASGTPLSGAQVTVPSLGIGATTRGDGSYTILVPAARIPSGPVTVNARLIGYKLGSSEVTLSGGPATADFALADNPLQLGEVVVTGAGTQSEVEKLGTVRNYVDSAAIVHSNEQNLVNALAAKAPNVTVVSSAGTPGASSYIQVRGLTTIEAADGQPLFVVDGVPIDNSTLFGNAANLPTAGGNLNPPNRLLDINPDDIENVEILKGASSGAIYGSQAGQGVVLITTKHGRPGPTKYSLRSSWSLDEHTQLPALQTEYGQGSRGVAPTCVAVGCVLTGTSFGPKLAPGTPVYDHASDIFQNGYTTDNALNVSGGNDRTTFFLSGGYSYNRGIVVGQNNHYRRISVRFNGTHAITDRLKVGANVAYSDGAGGFVQAGNDVGGLLIGSWRTSPEFNNLPYVDPVFGQQRSYRFPNPGPGTEQVGRVYNNPFFTAYQNLQSSQVGRTFGGVNAEWTATSWLKFNENLGYDYWNDERLQGWPWSNSETAVPGANGVGGVDAGYLRNTELDHNLTGTITYRASQVWKGTITVGQNLHSTTFRTREQLGTRLIAPQPFNLSNTARLSPPYDFGQVVHLESYFAQATADLWDQLYLTAAVRNDGASTFGASSRRNWFPKGSAAWVFYRSPGGTSSRFITYGKIRAAYGQSGTQPLPYLLSSVLNSTNINDGGWGPVASTQVGPGGLVTNFKLPATELGPERVKEFETGVDLGLFADKADLSVTHYRQNSDGVIISIPVATSTGYSQVPANAASLQNRGWEVSLNVRPVNAKSFGWEVGLQWARNRGLTTALANNVTFDPFPNSGGTNTGPSFQGVAIPGYPIGVYYGIDFVRCGRGLTVDGVAIDNAPTTAGGCGNAPAGALFIGADGYPRQDSDNFYVLGDPNPDWTGSVRTSFRIGKLSLGGLLDVRHGGVAYNGTTGALNQFGVALRTAQARDGGPVVFGQTYFPELVPGPAAGPGYGKAVPLDQDWWTGLGGIFSSMGTPFIEDGGFVKIREVSLGYTIDQPWVSRSLGFSSIDLRVAGRNLVSWNNYSGVDPETSSNGASTPIRGIDYFNLPQARSFVFSVTLNR